MEDKIMTMNEISSKVMGKVNEIAEMTADIIKELKSDLYKVIGDDETAVAEEKTYVYKDGVSYVVFDLHFENGKLLVGVSPSNDDEINEEPYLYFDIDDFYFNEQLELLNNFECMFD